MPTINEPTSDEQPVSAKPNSLPRKETALEIAPVRLPVGFRNLLIFGTAALLLLAVVSTFAPFMLERIKFFTVNALSLLVVLVIIVQAYIYRKQWSEMRRQADTSDKLFTETSNLVRHNDSMVQTMQGQLDEMKERPNHALAARG